MDDNNTLPARRQINTIECEFDGWRFQLSLGFYPIARIGDVRADGLKHGSGIDLLAQDACALIRECLQRYLSPGYLMERMQRTENGAPASLIGAIIHQLEQESAAAEQ